MSNLLRRNNFDDSSLFTFRSAFNDLFSDFFSEIPASSALKTTESKRWQYLPQVDIHEDEKSLLVTAEIPGVDEKDIHLSLEDNVLLISGEKKSEVNKDEKGVKYQERFYGSFRRAIPLALEVDNSKIEALYQNGVLKIVLPKKQIVKNENKRIEIKKA